MKSFFASFIATTTIIIVTIIADVSFATDNDIVTLANGARILGVRDIQNNIRFWRGVPYGESCAGDNRFLPPVPAKPWENVLNCTMNGPGCISDHGGLDTAPIQSENCLNLNIFVPYRTTSSSSSSLPVVVWIYGGSFAEGYNAGPFDLYDGTYISSKHEVILVAINYRLGPFGFAVTDKLNGNFGIMDQQLALKWVRNNIHVFGGNYEDVTIWGESAGAMSVGIHLISHQSEGLFSKAIMDSNPVGMLYKEHDKAKFYGLEFCMYAGCNISSTQCNHTCLRRSTSTTVLKNSWKRASSDLLTYIEANWGHIADGFLDFIPNVDGNVLPTQILPALESGHFSQVPVLIGTNENEAATFVFAGVKDSLPDFLWWIAADLVFKNDAKQVIDYYEPYGYKDARQSLSHVFTDYWFRCSSQKFATAARANGLNAWIYRYNHVISESSIVESLGMPKICATEVCHASELPFVFHKVSIKSPKLNVTLTEAEQELSAQMVEYWANFIKTGDPNGKNNGLPHFPLWNVTSRVNMNLNETMGVENSLDLCSFWDKIGYNY